MHKFIVMTMATGLVAAVAALPTRATAMDVSAAVKACDNNPNCGYGDPDAGGGMLLTVCEGTGKKRTCTYIDCPPKGDCQILIKGTKIHKATSTATAGVQNILEGSRRPGAPKAGGILQNGGILNGGGGLSSGGPASMGTRVAPSAPPPVQLR